MTRVISSALTKAAILWVVNRFLTKPLLPPPAGRPHTAPARHGVRVGGGIGARVKAAIGQYVIYLFLISLLFRGVDHAAHIGGFVSGFVLGWVLPYGTYRTPGQRVRWEAVTYLLALLTVLSWVQVALQFPSRGA